MATKSTRVGLTAILTLSLVFAPECAGAQTLPPQGAIGCKPFDTPIGKLEGGIVAEGRIFSCPNGIEDITAGPNRLRPGEMIVMSSGRVQNKQLPFVLRGLPNTAYPFPVLHIRTIAGTYLYDPAYHPLTGLGRALPFQPKQVVNLGKMENGQTGYGYTGIEILPSHARDAYPLNRRSIIVAVDGYNFVSPPALTSYLANAGPNEPTTRYVEVAYYQAEDTTPTLRRAFIPVYRRALVEPEWSSIAATNRAFEIDYSRGATAMLMFVGIAAAVAAFAQSDMGQKIAREQDQCMKEHQGTARVIIC